MKVILTDDANDRGERTVAWQADCACDCDCACPVDGAPQDGVPLQALSLPVAYYLELTPACHNRCPGCGNVYAADRASLPRPLDGGEWCNAIACLASHAHQFKLTGGEPTLHPDFADIVRAIQERGISFALFTNGRWADTERLIWLLRDTPACDGLLVSLHGPDAATHEAFSGVPGSFQETAANVRRAAEAGLEVATSLVLTRHNWDRVAETLALALDLGANHVVCNRWIGALAEGIAPSEAQLRTAMATVESLRAAGRPIRFGNCIPQCFQPSSATGCTAGSTFATVDPWGRVRPCNHAPLVAGDLRTRPIEEIWQGPVMEEWRALVPAACVPCPAYATCHGGCRAQAMWSGLARDPLMRGALPAVLATSEEKLLLYGGLRPVGQFAHRREGGRDVLIHRSQATVVPFTCRDLWPRLDGSLTLRQIERQYGDRALAWMGVLYRQGMVS